MAPKIKIIHSINIGKPIVAPITPRPNHISKAIKGCLTFIIRSFILPDHASHNEEDGNPYQKCHIANYTIHNIVMQ